jgi:hypothetical protein
MSTSTYHEVLIDVFNRTQHLTADEQHRLLKDLEVLFHRQDNQDTEEQLHNIMEFKGFAKEIWKDVDIKKYIEEERNSWDG